MQSCFSMKTTILPKERTIRNWRLVATLPTLGRDGWQFFFILRIRLLLVPWWYVMVYHRACMLQTASCFIKWRRLSFQARSRTRPIEW
jgi:hypothetical protein